MIRLLLSIIITLGPVCAQGIPFNANGMVHAQSGGGQTPAFVSGGVTNETNTSGGSTTIVTTGTFAIATNAHVCACVGHGEAGSTVVSSVVDNNGGSNSLTQVAHSDDGGTTGAVDLWCKSGAIANASATLTATFNASATFRWISPTTYSGVATTSSGDGSSCNVMACNAATTSVNATAVNITTTQAIDLLKGCFYAGNVATWTANNSFNMRTGTGSLDHQDADRVVSSTGSYPGGNIATLGTSRTWLSVFAAFKGAP